MKYIDWCLFIGFLLAQEWKCLGSHISFHACTVQYVTQSQHMTQQLNNNIFWECISQFQWYALSSGNIWLNNLVGQSEIRSHRPIYTRGLGLKAVFLRNFKKNKKCKQIKTNKNIFVIILEVCCILVVHIVPIGAIKVASPAQITTYLGQKQNTARKAGKIWKAKTKQILSVQNTQTLIHCC